MAIGLQTGITVAESSARFTLEVTFVDQRFVTTPVADLPLLLTLDDRLEDSLRIVTGPHGTLTAVVPAGSYVLRSESPFEFEGQAFEWTYSLKLTAGDRQYLQLNRTNATALPVPAPRVEWIRGHTYRNEPLGFPTRSPRAGSSSAPGRLGCSNRTLGCPRTAPCSE